MIGELKVNSRQLTDHTCSRSIGSGDMRGSDGKIGG